MVSVTIGAVIHESFLYMMLIDFFLGFSFFVLHFVLKIFYVQQIDRDILKATFFMQSHSACAVLRAW